MRRLAVAILVMAAADTARAADFPDFTSLPILRGGLSEGSGTRTVRWRGFYAGGQYGFSSTRMNADDGIAGLQTLATNTFVLSAPTLAISGTSGNTTINSFGGFAGYNFQWDDVVLGVDVNYNDGGPSSVSTLVPSTTVQTVGPNTYTTTTTGYSSLKFSDHGAVRVRAGWAVGYFLPYATIGASIGRADMTRSVTMSGSYTPGPVAYGPISGIESKTGAFIYGYSIGGGVDVMMTRGLFLRGEVEVANYKTDWGVDTTVTSGRIGAGYRF